PQARAAQHRPALPPGAKLIVDAGQPHLYVPVAGGEGVSRCESRDGRRCWDSEAVAGQLDKVILEFQRPGSSESPLESPAPRPATVPAAIGATERRAGRHIVDGETLIAHPSAAPLCVDKPAVSRDTDPTG